MRRPQYITSSQVPVDPENIIVPAPDSHGNVNLAPAKIYRALLTQSGTAAPVATVLTNTLGGVVVWSRSSAGIYAGTLAGAFPNGKTFANIINNNNAGGGGEADFILYLITPDTDAIGLDVRNVDLTGNTTPNGDNLLTSTAVEVLVYP